MLTLAASHSGPLFIQVLLLISQIFHSISQLNFEKVFDFNIGHVRKGLSCVNSPVDDLLPDQVPSLMKISDVAEFLDLDYDDGERSLILFSLLDLNILGRNLTFDKLSDVDWLIPAESATQFRIRFLKRKFDDEFVVDEYFAIKPQKVLVAELLNFARVVVNLLESEFYCFVIFNVQVAFFEGEVNFGFNFLLLVLSYHLFPVGCV